MGSIREYFFTKYDNKLGDDDRSGYDWLYLNFFAHMMVIFISLSFSLLLGIRLGKGGEDINVTGGDDENDCYGIFWICLKWQRQKVYDGNGGR